MNTQKGKNDFEVTVIIPTTGLKERKESLYRAIRSVLEQSYGKTIPLVMLNGTVYHKPLLKELRENDKILFKYLKKGSLPNAVFEARKIITTDFFSFLDDDDYYTEDCIEKKISQFKIHKNLDVVVGNGYKVFTDKLKKKMFSNIDIVSKNPMGELTKYNWFGSCSALFKTKSITLDFFDPDFKYYEWTYMAYKLFSKCNIKIIDDITFYINSTENSLSKSEEYILSQPLLFSKLRLLNLPVEISKAIERKKINSYHSLSEHYLKSRSLKKAWIWHLKSLSHSAGWKFLPYTWKLLLGRIY